MTGAEHKLGDLVEIQTGPFGSQLHARDYVVSGTPMVMPTNIGQRLEVVLDEIAYVSDADISRLERYLVTEGDIVYSRRGDVEKCAYITDKQNGWLCGGGCLRIRVSNDALHAKFLAYYLSTRESRAWILNSTVGSTMPNLNSSILLDFPLRVPPIDEQRAIAEVLSSLDDKIDLLHRQNKTLESLAETLFRQWFIVDAKPDWPVQRLGDSIEVKRGGSPRPIHDFIADAGLRWLKISDVTSMGSPYIFDIKEKILETGLSKTVHLQPGSLVLSNSATPGIPKILCVDSCIHDGWLYFPKSEFSKYFLYLLFKTIRNDLVSLGNGSIFTNLKTDIVKDFPFPRPDKQTAAEFERAIEPLFEKQLENEKQVRSLTQIRDSLLPKLMSGDAILEA